MSRFLLLFSSLDWLSLSAAPLLSPPTLSSSLPHLARPCLSWFQVEGEEFESFIFEEALLTRNTAAKWKHISWCVNKSRAHRWTLRSSDRLWLHRWSCDFFWKRTIKSGFETATSPWKQQRRQRGGKVCVSIQAAARIAVPWGGGGRDSNRHTLFTLNSASHTYTAKGTSLGSSKASSLCF